MSTPISLPPKPRILVVTLRRIGDALLTTPLIRSLRRAFADATIDVLTFAAPASIIEGNPDVSRVIVAPTRLGAGGALTLIAPLFKRYDLAVATQPGDRPTSYALWAGRRHAGLTDPEGPALGRVIKGGLLQRSTPTAPRIHRVEQMLRLTDALGIPRAPEVVGPAPAPLPFAPGESYAVIHAAPMFRYKEWTPDGWRALADGLTQRGLSIVAIGGPDPEERRALDAIWQGRVPIHQLTWPQNVALLQKARLFVGPDTSTTHLAAATGCPTVALFGPTDPRIWGPWPAGGLATPWDASGAIQQRGNVVLVQNPLPCLPCQLEGCERNITSASMCLQELAPAQVLAAAEQVLAAAEQALNTRR
jgi:heptosyltransferase-3